MFTVVLLAALTAGENVADFGKGRGGCGGGCYGSCAGSCYGGSHSCYGGCYGSCYGWSSQAYYGGCYGKACHGGSYGCGGGCMGVVNYGSSGYGGCYGGCAGGWGAPYSGYGSACYGGCGGYSSAAYGVPSMPIGVPVITATGGTMGKGEEMVKSGGERAVIVFKLPEGAKVFVEDQPIDVSATKTFRSPVLEAGKTYVYSMRVEVENKDGEKQVGTTTVNVKAGREELVDLTAVEMKKDVKVAGR